MVALVLCLTAPLAAQEPRGGRLIDQAPYDVLTLNEANEGKVLKIYPVDLPGRRLPEKPRSTDRLKIKLLEDNQEYEVAFYDIAKLDFFEELVLTEALKLATAGKYDESYDYFRFLFDFYPHTQGLNETRQLYLYLSAGAAFRQRQYDEALAVLEELLSLNPSFRAGESSPSLIEVLGNITDRLLARYVEAGDFRSARTLLSRLTRQYRAENEPFAQRWRQQFTDMAAGHRDSAREHLAAGRFVEAHDEMSRMQQIWPELDGAAELAAEIARRYPLVVVGVEHPARAFDPLSLHDAAARRAGRLRERLLVEFAGPGPEGGEYRSPLATIQPSDDGRQLHFRLPRDAGPSAAYELVQRLLDRARPQSDTYLPQWARTLSTVRANGTTAVQADLRTGHVLPQALLQLPLGPRGLGGGDGGDGTDADAPLEPYLVLSQEPQRSRYTINGGYTFRGPGQPAEVVERYFADPQRALLAIQRGEIDVLDRVYPGDIPTLEADPDVAVAPYRTPTTHVLVVRSEHPYLANRTFRRSLLYGSNRELILRQGILRGRQASGFRVISGPFPAPSSAGDLAAYGYDPQIAPRPYDPRLALTLRMLGEGEVKAAYEKAEETVPLLTPVVLGHPADETSRIACRALARQWKQIGVETTVVEFAPGVFDDHEGRCDLVYLQLAAWEPLVDASRLLSQEGLAPADSAFVQLTLRQIEAAQNWQQARARLLHLHRLIHEDVTLIPLWQTMDHFAWRRSIQGISPGRVALYQDIEQWQLATQLAGRTP